MLSVLITIAGMSMICAVLYYGALVIEKVHTKISWKMWAHRQVRNEAIRAADRERRIREGQERNTIVQRERAAQRRMERQNVSV